jgi:hypothetical protein
VETSGNQPTVEGKVMENWGKQGKTDTSIEKKMKKRLLATHENSPGARILPMAPKKETYGQ